MAWLSRVNFIASDTLSFTDVNNLGNDIRAWGDNVNGGGYTLSNVVVSASAGTMATLSGGSAASSTLIVQSTSGAGTTDAIIFRTGSQVERARFVTGGNFGLGTTTPSFPLSMGAATGNRIALFDLGGGSGYGFGIQSNLLQIFANTVADRVGIGYGNSSSFTETLSVDGANVKIGGLANRATTAGTNQLVLFNGTAPVGTLANGASFYVTSGEMRVMDAAGNATLLSPHDQTTNEWIYDSQHTPSGKRLKINVEKLLRFVNEHFRLDCISEFTGVAQ
jgi:hypothetical protein